MNSGRKVLQQFRKYLANTALTVSCSVNIRERAGVRPGAACAFSGRAHGERVCSARREAGDSVRRGVRAAIDRAARRTGIDQNGVVNDDAVCWRRRRPVQLDRVGQLCHSGQVRRCHWRYTVSSNDTITASDREMDEHRKGS